MTIVSNERNMKRWLKRIGLGLLAVLTLAALYGYAYRDVLEREWKFYFERETARSISRYCSDLPPVDEVRLLRLEDKPGDKNLGTFDVSYSEPTKMYIVQTMTLIGTNAQAFTSHWRALHLHPKTIAACYDPHHVIQFRANGTCISEAIVCFKCGNTTLPAIPSRTIVSFVSWPKGESDGYMAFKTTVENLVGKHE